MSMRGLALVICLMLATQTAHAEEKAMGEPTLQGKDYGAMKAALDAYQQHGGDIDARDCTLRLVREENVIHVTILPNDRPEGARGGPGYEVTLDPVTLAIKSQHFIR